MKIAVDGPTHRPAPPQRAMVRFGVEAVGMAAVIVAAGVSSVFAHQFREVIFRSIEFYAGSHLAPEAATRINAVQLFLTVTGGLMIASWFGRRSFSISGSRLGLGSVAGPFRGEEPGPALIGTLVRATGTYSASAGLASIGREAAILETGAAVGSGIGRQLRRRLTFLPEGFAPAIAAAGVAAAFAAAYHAPLAGIIYVEEHVGVRRQRRSLVYTLIGAALGHLIAVSLLDGHRIFDPVPGPRSDVLLMGLLIVVPSVIGSSLFVSLRMLVGRLVSPLTDATVVQRRMVASALAGGAIAVVSRKVAGNGMETIRLSAAGATVGLILALAIGKMFATAAALGSGAPGGIFTPTMSVSVGWALLTCEVLRRAGVTLPGSLWSAVIAALAVGIAVGLKSPFVAMFAIPEMTGDLGILPFVAVVVGLAVALHRGGQSFVSRSSARRKPAVSVSSDPTWQE